MKLRGVVLVFCVLALGLFVTACVHQSVATQTPPTPSIVAAPVANQTIATKPTYVPDYSHASQPLPDGIIAWDSLNKNIDVAAEADFAYFNFSFTNITKSDVVILSVHPSCGCTTAELPPTPWIIAAGGVGKFEAKVNLNAAGHMGVLFKHVTVTTDKGMKDIGMRINILPPVVRKLSDAERQMGVQMAKVNRQAVFHGDCASCHAKEVQGQYGIQLYNSVCGICHDAEHRASVVPDLSKLTVPTNQEFWRTWITYGKPGTLMPAFATAQGGPLTDIQIASLTQYLDTTHPSHVPTPQ